LAIRQQLVVESPAQGGFKNELASTEVELGRMLAPTDAKRADTLITQGIARARLLVTVDTINNEWKETLVQGLLAQAALFAIRGDAVKRKAALTEALGVAQAAVARAPQNAQWPCYLAEIDLGLARYKQARELLEALDKEGRLPAPRRPLLDRARA